MKNKSNTTSLKKLFKIFDKETFKMWKFEKSKTMTNQNKRNIKDERMRQKRAGEYYSKDFLENYGYVPGKRI
jgi:hypothetical protein